MHLDERCGDLDQLTEREAALQVLGSAQQQWNDRRQRHGRVGERDHPGLATDHLDPAADHRSDRSAVPLSLAGVASRKSYLLRILARLRETKSKSGLCRIAGFDPGDQRPTDPDHE